MVRELKYALLAAVVQVSGDLAPVACGNCLAGQGDWLGCVVPSALQGGVMAECANCLRRGIGGSCSLRMGVAPLAYMGTGWLHDCIRMRLRS